MVIARKHIDEELFFPDPQQVRWQLDFLPIEMKSSAATEEGFESLFVAVTTTKQTSRIRLRAQH